MAFPTGWPGRAPSGHRSIRFYQAGTSTANFSDNAFLFINGTGANPYAPLPELLPGGERTNIVVPPTPFGTGVSKLNANPDPAAGPTLAPPIPLIWCRALLIKAAAGGAVEFSFDGVNVHGSVTASTERLYFDRFEAGIAVRGAGGSPLFVIEAW